MKRALLGIALCALAMAPEGAAIARHYAAPSSRTGYVGKYPSSNLRGIAAMKDRHARTEVATGVCSAIIREAVRDKDMITQIIKVGDRLRPSGYESRSAGSANLANLTALPGSKAAVCSYTEVEHKRLDWCVDGNVVDTAYPRAEPTRCCPSEAGDLASLDTFPIGSIPK
ncbi:hypothetical protein [Novosphingobium sp. P6W]|uniref:hypothetical protein n=1 Tax=Novosphingobium sp. P6W TaxID=1609758 RepID=UPI0005C2EB07|nr:hypothetical protein [Novosphingobium sp. P6W]AXB78663.1 hypothetical protein TQ38_018785 [Novosphingobium sp. P6W]KIS30033.1 hypothetical protein TQ38_25095 [Novosphingobium sp. P6W]